MDGVRLRRERDADDLGDREIGFQRPELQFARRAAPDLIGLVRLEAMQRELVLLGVDRDRLDAELRRRAKDADRDFAAVGDEEPLYFYRHWMQSRIGRQRRVAAFANIPQRRSLGKRKLLISES